MPPFIVFNNDLERMPTMKHKCGNCGHFESKGVMTGSTNWGLCAKLTKAIADNKQSPFFRWEDDTCNDFQAKNQLSESHSHSDNAR
jgi:hypothetical protein